MHNAMPGGMQAGTNPALQALEQLAEQCFVAERRIVPTALHHNSPIRIAGDQVRCNADLVDLAMGEPRQLTFARVGEDRELDAR